MILWPQLTQGRLGYIVFIFDGHVCLPKIKGFLATEANENTAEGYSNSLCHRKVGWDLIMETFYSILRISHLGETILGTGADLRIVRCLSASLISTL